MQSINNYLLSNTNRTDVFLSLAESADSAEISFRAAINNLLTSISARMCAIYFCDFSDICETISHARRVLSHAEIAETAEIMICDICDICETN